MKLILDIFFFFMITFFCYHFVQIILKLKEEIIFPLSESELSGIRKQPGKMLKAPTNKKLKWQMIVYGFLLVIAIFVYLIGIYYTIDDLSFYLLFILIFTYSTFALDLFALNQSGILNGVRFIPWGKINSFQFIPIDLHHRLYGFIDDVNDGYELRLKGRTTVISCFVTNKEVKENLERILEQKVKKR